ncbi:protein phosphatase 1 regulatory subunit 15B-like [Hemiscyllium ocellatum]|uniref:protein phosphatase 1 regulatory subunit 15B-like n=1 Tax=Hemiscyllium ocellatum TaxID=170820 RepID=UPI0029667F11|nr:protein phosphatase 1 regulatory subunit 15B-like [Hemiscyllium ocellatum]
MNWEPPGPAPAAASCSDGGLGGHPGGPGLYQSPLMKLISVFYRPSFARFHRPEADSPLSWGSGLLRPVLDKMRGFGGGGERESVSPLGGLWAAAWHWVGATEPLPPAPPLEERLEVIVEAPPPLKIPEPPAPGCPGLFSKVMGRISPPETSSISHPLRPGLPQPLELANLGLPQWSSGYPAASMQQVLAPAEPGFHSTQQMEKPLELFPCHSGVGIATPSDQDYGYSSLEEEHAGSQCQDLRYSGKGVPPEPAPSVDSCSKGSDLKANRVACMDNGKTVPLPLSVDSTVPNLQYLDIENRNVSMRDDEWDSDESSSEELDDDAEEEDDCYPLSRPQCSNKTIAYILGSDSISDSDDSEEDEDSDSDDDGFDSDGSSSELSDTDEELLNFLAGTSDPYNLMNFQACIKTRHKVDTRTVFQSSCTQQSEMCTIELEDDSGRVDSGFTDEIQSEVQKTFTQMACEKKCSKKVAFDEHVTVHYVSSEEIRKGPWEEFARDRCRFQKRIQEIEECIGYCFTLKHRRTVLKNLQLSS